MLASNNSPLLKDSQKTKGTIWKPLTAVSSLSIFSFISGQYLPYVIIAVSGSGTIAAVPLAIFAVSAVVALISTIYLIRLAVSRADSKKEAGLDGEESGHIASQEPQKFVCENCTNLENKSNVPTPQSPPVTLGTQPSASAPPPPPPPPPPPTGGLTNWNPQKKNTTREKSPVSTTQKNTTTEESTPPEDGKQPEDFRSQLFETLAMRREAISGKQKDNEQQPNELGGAFSKMSDRIPPPRSRSDSVSSNSSEESEQDWSDDEDQKSIGQAFSNPQSFHKERSESPDSDYGSDDNVKPEPTSPLHSQSEVGEPLVQSKSKNEPAASQVNSVDPVNSEMKDSFTSSVNEQGGFKKLTSFWENQGRT